MESLRYNSISLFGGEDLQGSWCPAANPKPNVGFSDGWGEAVLSSTPTEPLSPATDYQGSSPFGSEWLDTRVDLLDYLAGPELEGLKHDELVVVGNIELVSEDPTAHAVRVLKSIAEDQSALLQQDAQDSNSCLLSPTTPTEEPELSVDTIPADLFDLFPETLDESVVDSALDPSSILAPMSPEDIDDILSSGPCSPDVTMDSGVASRRSSYGSLEASTELDVSMGSMDTSTGVTTDIQTIDLGADLIQLLQEVQAPPSPPIVISLDAQNTLQGNQSPVYSPQYSPEYSSEYSPAQSPEPESTTFRSKPYERPRKPGSKKGLPREVIQQERKMRKKQQNKDAATRYRQKKKAEKGTIDQEVDILEARNTALHDSVDSMTKEIRYLKDLLAEVYAAKGLKLPISAS